MPSPLMLEVRPEQLCGKDPLAKVLYRLIGVNSFRAWLSALVIYSVFYVGIGWWVSLHYQQLGYPLLPIYDEKELLSVFFTGLLVAPIVWVFYLREPLDFVRLFQGLASNQIVGQSISSYKDLDQYVLEKISTFNNPKFLAAVLAIFTSILALWLWQTTNTTNWFLHGYSYSWWAISPYYFWLAFLPLAFVNLYMVLWILVRRLITRTIVNDLFNSFETTPQPFHSDRANGMFPIGRYSLRIAPLLMLAGLFVTFFIAYPIYFGGPPNLKVDTVLFVIIYVVSVFLVLLVPVWGTHLFMQRKKAVVLDVVAEELRILLAQNPSGDCVESRKRSPSSERSRLVDHISDIESLEKKYRILDSAYRTWPFDTSSVARFVLIVSSPLLTALLTIVVDVIIGP